MTLVIGFASLTIYFAIETFTTSSHILFLIMLPIYYNQTLLSNSESEKKIILSPDVNIPQVQYIKSIKRCEGTHEKC